MGVEEINGHAQSMGITTMGAGGAVGKARRRGVKQRAALPPLLHRP